MLTMRVSSTVLISSAFSLVSCTSPGPSPTAPVAPEPEPKAEPKAEAAPAKKEPTPALSEDEKSYTFKMEVGDGLNYSTNRIEVKAGKKMELTLVHTGSLPKNTMGHNFVLLKKGTEMAKFATAAMGAFATDYIPAEQKDAVIAHTKVVGGGESDTVAFKIPGPGEYIYLCTFPGHYASMNGKLVVTE